MHFVEGDELVRDLTALFTAATHLLLSIPGNILEMSKSTKIALSVLYNTFSIPCFKRFN